MSELRNELRRLGAAFEPDAGGFGRLVARRRRRRVARQVLSITTALCVAAGGMWFAVRELGPLRPPGRDLASAPIAPDSVSTLRLAWTSRTSADHLPALSLGAGHVFLSSPHQTLVAFPAVCPSRACGVQWRGGGLVPTGIEGGPSAVVGGLAFATSDRLAAFPVNCGKEAATCSPIWTGVPARPARWVTSPVVAGGLVYVGTDDGRVLAFSPRCRAQHRTCGPVSSVRAGTGAIEFTPAIDGGQSYVVASGRLLDVPTSCRRPRCGPRWSADVGVFPSAPAAADGWSYISTGRRLLAFRAAGCKRTAPSCAPAWTFASVASLSPPTAENGMVFVAGSHLYALTADCPSSGGCAPVWSSDVRISTQNAPVVADGLVFVTSGNRVFAFPSACGSSTCPPAWVSPPLEPFLSAPAVGRDSLFVAGESGTLYAFGTTGR
jgi:outer membrane protein assembly factor BamB